MLMSLDIQSLNISICTHRRRVRYTCGIVETHLQAVESLFTCPCLGFIFVVPHDSTLGELVNMITKHY